MFSDAPSYADLIQLGFGYGPHIGKILQRLQNNMTDFFF